MIQNISLNIPGTIEFGLGKIETLQDHLRQNRRIFFLVDEPVLALVSPIFEEIKKRGVAVKVSTEVIPEPPFESLEALLAPVKAFDPDVVVGIGGGSTMDLAKLVAVLFTGEQRIEEIIGIDNVIGRTVKLITVSTTSGTGSEVTPIAVLTDARAGLKKGVVSKHIIPDVAIVDPELTIGMPSFLTAVTGMDAMTHCIEAYTNRFAHPIIDALALEGIKMISRSLEDAVKNGTDKKARTEMALGSLYGGLCLGPVNTAAVHALAYPLGGIYKISHGVSNSVLLPFVMNYNFPSCITRYAEIGRAMGLENQSSDESLARSAIDEIRKLSDRCQIPGSLKALDVPESAIPEMAVAAMEVQRLLQNNPREVGIQDAKDIYEKAYNGVML
jgi:alcohol dehydrogenase